MGGKEDVMGGKEDDLESAQKKQANVGKAASNPETNGPQRMCVKRLQR
jgi:hypothetical protein